MDHVDAIRRKFELLAPTFNEASRRRWAAAEAIALGRGGQALVHRATGIARHTIRSGIRELQGVSPRPEGKQRRPGGGRKRAVVSQPGLQEALDALVDPETRGDPMCPLRWTTKSTTALSRALADRGYRASPRTVARLLREAGYSLQGTKKTREGNQHPDRDAQFRYIHDTVQGFLAAGNPVLSVDAKKKELVGDFSRPGREWQPKGEPVEVRVHDFIDPELGKVVPYGAYDLARNEGWVNVGISADTGEFATESLRRWWHHLGQQYYSEAQHLLVVADGGGSNGSRLRAWKVGLQVLADDLEMPITVMHLPPGTSKWNKIEHRMFSFITLNWRGRPLDTVQTVIELIRHTTTKTGLRIAAELDSTTYQTGVRIDDDIMAALHIERHTFHPEWNYTIYPM